MKLCFVKKNKRDEIILEPLDKEVFVKHIINQILWNLASKIHKE